jgi:hypothetical protein
VPPIVPVSLNVDDFDEDEDDELLIH